MYGDEYIQVYVADDYRYQRGQKDSGQRAVLPNSFKSYGYTKQFQDGNGNSAETEQGISNEVDDTQYDIGRGKLLSEDQLLAQTENKVNQVPVFDDLLDDDLDFDIIAVLYFNIKSLYTKPKPLHRNTMAFMLFLLSFNNFHS